MLKKNFLWLLFLITSICLVGLGTTGMVVSQSCCFLPFCESGNLCDALESDRGYPTIDQLTMFMGVAMFISLFVTYSVISR